jgi:FKBP-type peptidyl-prolyl cis-trans isomerase FkpA
MKLKYAFALFASILAANTLKAQTGPQPNFQKTPKGVLYHIFSSGDTAKIKMSDVITFNAVQKTEKDSILFSTYNTGNPVKIQVQPSQNIGDLQDIFLLLAAKDSAIVKVPADSVFKGHEEQRPPFLPKESYLVFTLKIDRVQSLTDAIAERDAAVVKMKDAENEGIKAYIAGKKLLVKTTPSGLKYVVTKPAIKPKPLNGDTVFVNYTGHTLDGKVFDSSIATVAKASGLEQPGRTYEPIKVTLGQGQVIKGWDEGLLLLNEGSKATFIIPSSLAYGERGASEDIKPYTPLVFELELVRVKRIHHAPVKHPVKKAVKKTTAVKKQ